MVMRIQSAQSSHTKQFVERKLRHRRILLILLVLCILAGGVYQQFVRMGSSLMSNQKINVYETETETLMSMDLETYIVGVVAAEMPASFELDALKAQAVAARTFALNRIQHPNSKVVALHPDAQITTSTETCQAWISDDTQRLRWGSAYDTWHEKIVQAVSETVGEVLYYENALIEPVYHASCGGGVTEASEDVWSTAKPYLISVPCNHPPDKHSGVTTVVSLTKLIEKLNLESAMAASVMNEPMNYITVEEKTQSNRVKEVRIGDTVLRGGEVRSALGLKSTLMNWTINGDEIIFTTNGYGHGAGMCQQGANYYAQQGYDYRQILRHYYPETILRQVQ